MKVFTKELFKAYCRRSMILVLFLFAGVNAALLYTNEPDQMITSKSLKEAYLYIEDLPENERANFIKERKVNIEYLHFTDDYYREYFLFRELNNNLEQIENYNRYLQDIQDRAANNKNISIFKERDPFSARNAQRTSKAYAPLEGHTLQFTNSHTFRRATEFYATDFIVIFLIFYLAITLVINEKEKGLFALFKPLTGGRGNLICVKTAVLLCSAIALALLFWSENLLITTAKYGAVNMSAYIQSIYGYAGSALNINIVQYWLIFLISKVFVYFIIGLIFINFALVSKSVVMYYVRSVLLLAISFALYWIIDGNSKLQVLKYMNIVNFTSTTTLYQHYFNLNFFSYPVNIVLLFIVSGFTTCICFFFLNVYVYCYRDSVITLTSHEYCRNKSPIRCHTRLVKHEAYKLFVVQKAPFILLLFVCLQVYLFIQESSYMNVDERYYKSYMSTLKGEVTDKTYEIIRKEQERLLLYNNMMEDAQQRLTQEKISSLELAAISQLVEDNTKGQRAFQRVLEHLAYLEGQEKTTGKIPWMVYETGYEKLTGMTQADINNDLKNGAVVLLVMIASFSAFFASEYSTGMINIISCYERGRLDTVKTKLCVAFPLFTGIFLLGYVPDFIVVFKDYSLPCATAGLDSIQSLVDFPVQMSLWQYLLLVYVYRYLVFSSILIIIFLISTKLKNTGTALSVLSVTMTLPAFLHILGLRWIDYFSLNAFISGNILLNNRYWAVSVLLLPAPLALGAFSYISLIRSYSDKSGHIMLLLRRISFSLLKK